MINMKNISLTNDGDLHRISISYDEFDETGKTISTNNRATRIITDKNILKNVKVIEDYALTIAEEG